MTGSLFIFLATVTASESLDDVYFKLAFACFALTGLCALLAAGMLLFGKKKNILGTWVAMSGTLLGLFPVGLSWYLHHVDFVPVAMDGTNASGPLWQALVIPILPWVLCFLLWQAHRRSSGSSQR